MHLSPTIFSLVVPRDRSLQSSTHYPPSFSFPFILIFEVETGEQRRSRANVVNTKTLSLSFYDARRQHTNFLSHTTISSFHYKTQHVIKIKTWFDHFYSSIEDFLTRQPLLLLLPMVDLVLGMGKTSILISYLLRCHQQVAVIATSLTVIVNTTFNIIPFRSCQR